jgi:hypothetical protein
MRKTDGLSLQVEGACEMEPEGESCVGFIRVRTKKGLHSAAFLLLLAREAKFVGTTELNCSSLSITAYRLSGLTLVWAFMWISELSPDELKYW